MKKLHKNILEDIFSALLLLITLAFLVFVLVYASIPMYMHTKEVVVDFWMETQSLRCKGE